MHSGSLCTFAVFCMYVLTIQEGAHLCQPGREGLGASWHLKGMKCRGKLGWGVCQSCCHVSWPSVHSRSVSIESVCAQQSREKSRQVAGIAQVRAYEQALSPN